jgi:lipopolysaccharide transport system permease protein
MKKFYYHFLDLYRHRFLIWQLVLRDIRARYRGSFFGFLWTFMNPLIQMLIYTLVFSFYMRINMEKYPAFLFCGLIPWTWVSSSVERGMHSIVHSGSLVTKAMLPPHVLPTTMNLSNFVNFIFTLPLLILFLLLFKVYPGLTIFFIVILFVIQFIMLQGVSLIVATLTVYFRDLLHVIPNLLLFIFFGTPIIYPLSMVPEKFRIFVLLNPFTPLIASYQNSLFFKNPPPLFYLLYSALWAIFLFILGVYLFEKFRDELPELI